LLDLILVSYPISLIFGVIGLLPKWKTFVSFEESTNVVFYLGWCLFYVPTLIMIALLGFFHGKMVSPTGWVSLVYGILSAVLFVITLSKPRILFRNLFLIMWAVASVFALIALYPHV